MKRALLILTVAVLLSLQGFAARAAPSTRLDVAAIDSFIQNEMKATHLPGLALGIVHQDEVIYLKGYGRADEAGNPVTPQTPFLLASTSRSFTALAVMQLVEAGKVDLDAPVQTYPPWFRVADASASARITVHQLLNHTSGLPGSAGMQFFTRDSDMETQARALANVELDRPVGESYEYVNPTYSVLALIVQEVSGQPFEEYIQQHIFNPLQMTNSFTSKDEARKDGMGTGHTFVLGLPVALNAPDNRGGIPYCCIISSAEDLSHYLIAQLNHGQYGSISILSPQGMDAMHTPAVPEDRPGRSYGMAWEVRSINGIPVVMHTGEGPGWQSNLIMIPKEGWGIVVLTNGYNFVDNNFEADRLLGIARGVTSLVVGQNPPPVPPGRGAYIFYGVLLVILIVQIGGMLRSIKSIRHWSNWQSSPQGSFRIFISIVLPLILNLLWSGLIFFGVPNMLMPYALMKVSVPMLAYTLLASGLVAFAWALTRTALAIQAITRTNAFARTFQAKIS